MTACTVFAWDIGYMREPTPDEVILELDDADEQSAAEILFRIQILLLQAA